MKISIDESKFVDKAQFCVVSYMNKQYLQELFEKSGIKGEIFDMPEVDEDKVRFPNGSMPFWCMFYEANPNEDNVEEVLTIIRANLDGGYLRELLISKDVRDDYHEWWMANPDELYDCYHAWNVFTDAGLYLPKISSGEAEDWLREMVGAMSMEEGSEDQPVSIHQLLELMDANELEAR